MAENDKSMQRELLDLFYTIFEPLGKISVSAKALQHLYGIYGKNAAIEDLEVVVDGLETFRLAMQRVALWIEQPPETLDQFAEALESTWQTIQAIKQLQAEGFPLPGDDEQDDVGAELIIDFVGLLVLQAIFPWAYHLGVLLNVIRPGHTFPMLEPVRDEQGRLVRFPHYRASIRWDIFAPLWDHWRNPGLALPQFLGNFLNAAGDIETDRILPALAGMMQSLGLNVVYNLKPARDFTFTDQEAALLRRMITYWHESAEGNSRFGLTLAFPTEEQRAADFPGGAAMVLLPFGAPQISGSTDNWDIELQGSVSGAPVWISNEGVYPLSDQPLTEFYLRLLARRRPDGEGRALLFGSTTGTRLATEGLQIQAEIRLGDNQDYGALLKVDGASLVVAPGDGDGFLQQILPADGLRADFDLALGWSQRRGLHLGGGAGLEYRAPLGATKPPAGQPPAPRNQGGVSVDELVITLHLGDEGLGATVGATVSGSLGPVTAVVENVGLQTVLALSAEYDGNLGPLDLAMGFKWPDGIGLSIDSGPLVGGGYLYLDRANQRYSGVLQLEFNEIQVQAIGLLSTRLPDGRPGYSLLVLISGQFEPIQLGLGFTLNGVGGLVGLHRAVAVETLRAGIRENTLDSLLFPRDPIRNAPQIISDLRRVFPPMQGRHLFGPMALIGWGKPNLLTAKIGLILEAPHPARLLLLGQARCLLPAPDRAIIRINVDVLGVLDFDRGEFSLDATVYDSKLAAFDLSGDVALRSRWRGEPAFALAIGGFNPRFKPPAGFPKLRRMMVSLGDGDNPRISLEGYLAVTTNSLQFGARAELYAAAGNFSVHGYLGFDALFILSPFSFVVDIAGGVRVRYRGYTLASVHLEATLWGPRPWRVSGKVKFKVAFFKVSKSFDKSFGPSQPIELPVRIPWPELQAAIADLRNWNALLPARTRTFVILRKSSPGAGQAPVHPMGNLELHQKVLPFDHSITRYGGSKPPQPVKFRISRVRAGNTDLATTRLDDYFAPGQYEEMSDDEKLTRRAFERMQAGVRVASDRLLIAPPEPRSLRYETIVLDEHHPTPAPVSESPISRNLALSLQTRSAAHKTAAANRGPSRFIRSHGLLRAAVRQERYVVVQVRDLRIANVPDAPASGVTQAQAVQALRAHLVRNPQQIGKLQVVPRYEAVGG
jgi:hypothetical protein